MVLVYLTQYLLVSLTQKTTFCPLEDIRIKNGMLNKQQGMFASLGAFCATQWLKLQTLCKAAMCPSQAVVKRSCGMLPVPPTPGSQPPG